MTDVIIVGAGVMGCATFYFLSKEGVRVELIEQTAIAHGASGVSAAMLEIFGYRHRFNQTDSLRQLAEKSINIHLYLHAKLKEETGIDVEYCEVPCIIPAFYSHEETQLKNAYERFNKEAFSIEWHGPDRLRDFEQRINEDVLGGIVYQQAQLNAKIFSEALLRAGEKAGGKYSKGKVIGLQIKKNQVYGVKTETGKTIKANKVIITMGPWSTNVSDWIKQDLPIYPVRGQILEIEVKDPQLRGSIYWNDKYLVKKANGTTLAGATEEHDSGFQNTITNLGKNEIINAVKTITPSLKQSKILKHRVGLRPCSVDGLPVIGEASRAKGTYVLSGHFRSGILLSTGSAEIIKNMVIGKKQEEFTEKFSPDRFL